MLLRSKAFFSILGLTLAEHQKELRHCGDEKLFCLHVK